jgi:hypothetical protein
MSTNILYQKDILGNRKYFEISNEELLIKSSRFFKSSEVTIKLDTIGTKVIKSKTGKKGWLIAAIVLLILSITLFIGEKAGGDTDKFAFLFYFIFSIGCFIVFILSYKSSFYLAKQDNKNAIEFLNNKPSKQELETFIAELKLRRNKALLIRYGQLSKMISYEQQYNNLLWLQNNDALTIEEYNAKLAELNSLFSAPTRITGFGNSSSDNER